MNTNIINKNNDKNIEQAFTIFYKLLNYINSFLNELK